MTREPERVSFKNGSIDIAGHLRLPDGFDVNDTYAALVVVTLGSSVKEQVGAVYGSKMADRGFVTLAFDPSYQGERGRAAESPDIRLQHRPAAIAISPLWRVCPGTRH